MLVIVIFVLAYILNQFWGCHALFLLARSSLPSVCVVSRLQEWDQVCRRQAASCKSSPVFSLLQVLGFNSTTPPDCRLSYAVSLVPASVSLPLPVAFPGPTPASVIFLPCLETTQDQLWTLFLSPLCMFTFPGSCFCLWARKLLSILYNQYEVC